MRRTTIHIISLIIIELFLFLPVSHAFSISGVESTDIKADSAKIKWSTDEYASGFVYYGETKSLGQSKSHSNFAFNHQLELSNLQAEKTYYYYVKSVDINGTEITSNNSGNLFEFKTLDKTPPEQVTGLLIQDIGTNSVNIKWDKITASDFKTYKIYRDSVNIANRTETLFLDTGLESDKTYEYKISAVDDSGNEGAKSSGVYAKTKAVDGDSPIISSIQITDITYTSAVIKWQTSKPASSVINYGINNINESKKEDSAYKVSHTLSLTGLIKSKNYQFKISSIDASNNCAYSGIRYFETNKGSSSNNNSVSDKTPPDIQAELPSLYNKNKIDISGTVEKSATVRLYVNDMAVPKRILGSTLTSGGTFKFLDVELSQNNKIKLLAKDEAGNSAEKIYNLTVDSSPPVVVLEKIPHFIKTNNFTLKGTINEPAKLEVVISSQEENEPPQVTGLKTEVKNGSVELSWDEINTSGFSHYVIYRDDVGAIATAEPSSYTSYTDILVNKGESYSYKVSAVNTFGLQGPYSVSRRVTPLGGSSDNPKPQEVENPLKAKEGTGISKDIEKGEFEEKISLKEGDNILKITFTDKAGNKASFEEKIKMDTKPPEIEISKPADGTFLYENYADQVEISGTTEPNTEVHLYIERTPLGSLNGTAFSGFPDNIESIPESRLRADCRMNLAGSSFCSTGADYSTKSDSSGSFHFDDIDLTNFAGIGASIKQVSATKQSREKDYSEQKSARLLFIATDSSGLRGSKNIQYNIGTCWSGNFSWDITPLTTHQSPSILSPERLAENTEEIFFYFNYTYVGIGEDAKITSVNVKPACGDLIKVGDKRFNISCRIIPPGANTVVNPEGTMTYSIMKLNRIENMDKWLENDWKGFFEAVKNELTFPLRVQITYTHEVNGKKVTEVQTTCQEVTYVLDNSLIDPSKVLPDWVLYDFVDFLKNSIESINSIQEKLRTVIDYTAYGCVASFVLRLGAQVVRRWSTFADEKSLIFKDAVGLEGFSFNTGSKDSAGDDEYCKEVIKAIKDKNELGDGKKEFDFTGFKLKYLSDSDLKRCFPGTYSAWQNEERLYKAYRLTCDRLFGHSTPSRWTETATDEELIDIQKKGTVCDSDQSARGQVLRAKECKEFTNYPKAKTLKEKTKCVEIYITKHDKALYQIGKKVEDSEDLYKLEIVDGFRSSERYAIKQTEESYQTSSYKTCAEICGYKPKNSGKENNQKKSSPYGLKEGEVFYEDTNFNNANKGEYNNGGYGCVKAKTCDGLAAKYNGKEQKGFDIKSSVRKGYTSDCFYSPNQPLITGLNNPKVVSDKPSDRFECCCISGEENKDKNTDFYRFDDVVLYKLEDMPSAAPAFESKSKEGEPPQGEGGKAWADMKWSYRYWKEGFQTISKTDSKITHIKYNPNRYIDGRDWPACFGQNSLFDKTGALGKLTSSSEEESEEESKETPAETSEKSKTEPKGSILILNPATQHVSAFQCVHISGIYNRLQIIKNMMNSLASCLISVRTSGKGDTAVCKELFTRYLCSTIWQVIQFFRDGCLPFNGALDFDKSNNAFVQYVGRGFSSVWGSITDSQTELANEYGNTKLNNMIGATEEQLARKICLGAFGFDWEIGLENIIDATYSSTYNSLVMQTTGTREFLTVDPNSDKARYEYKSSWIVNPGCDLSGYKVELACVSNKEADTYPGIDCSSVKDPSGGGCDCINLNAEKTTPWFTKSKSLSQSSFDEESYHKIIAENYRYDHIKVTLTPDLRMDSDSKEECFGKGHLVGNKGVYYFPLRDRTMIDLADCHADLTLGIFKCGQGEGFWTSSSRATITDVEVEIAGNSYDSNEELRAYNGDTITVVPTVNKLSGKPLCLLMTVRKSGLKDEMYQLVDMDSSQNYEFYLGEATITEKGGALLSSEFLEDKCEFENQAKKEDTCDKLKNSGKIKLKILETNIKEELKDVIITFDIDKSSNHKDSSLDLSDKAKDNDKDIITVKYDGKTISQKFEDLWDNDKKAIVIKLDKIGDNKGEVILSLSSVSYKEGVTKMAYKFDIDSTSDEEQGWDVKLELRDRREDSDCQKPGPVISSSLGKTSEKFTINVFNTKQSGSTDATKPRITITLPKEKIDVVKDKIEIPITVKDYESKIEEVTIKLTNPAGKSITLNELLYFDNKKVKDVGEIKNNKIKVKFKDEGKSNDFTLKLDKKTFDNNKAGTYKIEVTAKDSERSYKENEKEAEFSVLCYEKNEGQIATYGTCIEASKKGECNKGIIKNPDLPCSPDSGDKAMVCCQT